jgi:hypothetical protein
MGSSAQRWASMWTRRLRHQQEHEPTRNRGLRIRRPAGARAARRARGGAIRVDQTAVPR